MELITFFLAILGFAYFDNGVIYMKHYGFNITEDFCIINSIELFK